jgi:hypothetical protein
MLNVLMGCAVVGAITAVLDWTFVGLRIGVSHCGVHVLEDVLSLYEMDGVGLLT